MSLKRPFVPKSDVKQWFTTTTTKVNQSSVYILFVFFQDTSLSDWDQAAIRIQACYRGYRGRQLYVERLYELYRQVC